MSLKERRKQAAGAPRKTKIVEAPEPIGAVRVKSLTLGERNRLTAQGYDKNGKITANLFALVLGMGVEDVDTREPFCNPNDLDEVTEVNDLPSEIGDFLLKEVLEISGMSDKDAEGKA